MKPEYLIGAFQALYDFGNKTKVIESRSLDIIRNVINMINQEKSDRTSKNTNIQEWGYEIPIQDAIRLKEISIDDYLYSVDIFCNFKWTDNSLPITQELVLRIWTSSQNLIYREEFDSEKLLNLATDPLGGRRVMLRCHFDLANPKQDGPTYHLQFGGNGKKSIPPEYCWYPSTISLPRFPYPPTDFFLLFQLVLKNYYKNDYRKLMEEHTWRRHFFEIQKCFLENYYQNCLDSIQKNKSLLDEIWNKD
jgi:hypothetical protein